MKRLIPLLAATALGCLTGCSSETTPGGPDACSADRLVGGVCVGVPAAALCESDTCSVEGCSSSTTVQTDAELTAALGAASAGACVLLRPGTYIEALVPSGVRLLGRGADYVTVSRVELGSGQGTTVRGLSVGTGGLVVAGTEDVVLDAVRVTGSSQSGIELQAGASATVTRSEVVGSERYALSAFDVASVTLEATLLEGATGPGLWAQCSGGCSCAVRPEVVISDTVIRDTKRVGLSLVGVRASLTNVEVRDNLVDGSFQPGGGIAVSGCSVVEGTGVRVLDNTNFGLLIDGSVVRFAPGAVDFGLDVQRNLRGIWVQHIGATGSQSVELRGLSLIENTGVSLGVAGESLGVQIADAFIAETGMVVLPVQVNGVPAGSETVGDGFNWLDQSQITVDGLTVSNSARVCMLIDGEVATGSSLASVTLTGGDESKGIYQQSLPEGGVQPTLGAGVPAIATSVVQTWPITERLGIPPEI